MTPELITVYLCPGCEQPFRESADARYCCPDYPAEADAWECGQRFPLCDKGFHLTKLEAGQCARGLLGICACGHLRKSHALVSQYPGCYDLDCRCPKFEQAQAVAA